MERRMKEKEGKIKAGGGGEIREVNGEKNERGGRRKNRRRRRIEG